MNAQFYDETLGDIQLVNLATREVFESHTGDNIRKWVRETLVSYDIGDIQLGGLAIDSASNITKAVDDFVTEVGQKVAEFVDKVMEGDEEEEMKEGDEDFDLELAGSDNDTDDDEENDEELDPVDDFGDHCVRIHCVAHRFQLAMGDFLFNKEKTIARLVSKAAQAMAKIRRTTFLRRLAATEVEKLLKPVLSQKTRWSSTYNMIKRLITYETFCKKYAGEKDCQALNISGSDWKRLHELVKILKPTEEFTRKLQYQNMTVPDCVHYWLTMKTSLDEIEKESTSPRMVRTLLKYINQREKKVFGNSFAQAGFYLGGQLQFSLDKQQSDKAKQVIQMIALKRFDIANPGLAIQDEESDNSESQSAQSLNETQDGDEAEVLQPPQPKLTPLQMIILKAKEARMKVQSEQQLEKEVEVTKVDPKQARKDYVAQLHQQFRIYEEEMLAKEELQVKPDSIKYWKENVWKFPILAPTALDLISCPMTEVSVERLFSHLAYILSPLRSCLSADILQDIIFLRVNNRFANVLDEEAKGKRTRLESEEDEDL